MKRRKLTLSRALILITALFAIFSLFPPCLSENYSRSYQLLDKPSGSAYYRLNIAVPLSLYEYYLGKSHRLNTETDFAKFVTPYALKPISESLRQIYADDEDLANGALMIVHQIPYEVTTPSKYPVETIVDNKGDCDLFSYIAASILKAAGLDVVLLYYEHEAHMNIGVSLSYTPHESRGEAFYVTNNHIRYYVAECTGGNWQSGWRVGECPDELERANVQVITLENCEKSATGQVSASYKTLAQSTLILTTSTTFVIQGSAVTLSGQLSPDLQSENVTIYIKVNNSPWTVLDTIGTDSDGRFSYVWQVEAGGICYVRASWSGNEDYSVADSQIRTITSLSTFFIVLLTVTVLLISVGTVTYFMSKQIQRGMLEPQPPEIPS